MGRVGGGDVTDELRSPLGDPLEHTSRYGPLFWSGVAVGSVVMGVGLVSLLSKAGATKPANFAVPSPTSPGAKYMPGSLRIRVQPRRTPLPS